MRFDLSSLAAYDRGICPTDMLPSDDLKPVAFGLYGEVGSVLAVAKKQSREGEAFAEHEEATEEEFGDVLWYFVTLCHRLGHDAYTVFSKAAVTVSSMASMRFKVDQSLVDLGKAASTLLDVDEANEQSFTLLCNFAEEYLRALKARGLSLPAVALGNQKKVLGRFVDPDQSSLPTFDDGFPDEERIPTRFEIRVMQRKSGQSQLQWNGVFIGDPLWDNIADSDGYRFHDVFHLANAAVLHWSPTFRSLIKQKRKSDPHIDGTQDSGRAIVVEEGLTAWIFSRAKRLRFFESQDRVSFDMLKTVQQFVRGYEVEQCPLRLWEMAILQGYEVFRQVWQNEGGVIVGDRSSRSISFMPL